MSGDDGQGDDGTRFEDLMGEGTRRLRRGPERIAPAGGARARRAEGREAGQGAGFRWPDPSDRLCAAAAGVSDATLLALARGEPAPEERIDLHGARRDAAGRLLARRIASARARGLRAVVVIHGRGQHSPDGEAVLRDALPGWLTRGATAREVLAFAPAPDRLGGRGATMVLLRRRT